MSELKYANPKHLTVVTTAYLKQHPDRAERLARYHSIAADSPLDQAFKGQVEAAGRIIVPISVEHIDEYDMDVVVAGRQRWKAARELGYTEVPIMFEDADDEKNTVIVEASENLARRNLSPQEQGEAYRKLFLAGFDQAGIAKLVGKTPAYISRILTVAEMPSVVHKAIDKGTLTAEAAYSLKDIGKKAAKGSGRQRIYDEKEVAAALNALSEEAKLVNGGSGKIKVKQANASKASSAELNKGNWDALYDHADTPDDYKALIGVFTGKLSIKQAKDLAPENLDWLQKIEKVKVVKPKKAKEPKEAKIKGSKKAEPKKDVDLNELFGE